MSQPPRLRLGSSVVVGVLSTVAGLAAGHLVAALTDPATSPVLVVGSTIIDLTPTPVKEWAVSTFGTKDKPILLGSVVAGTLALAALAGVLTRRRLAVGASVLAALAATAGIFAVRRPAASPLDVLPAVVAGIVGLAALWWLARPRPAATDRPDQASPQRLSRRGVLVVGVAAAGLAVAGEWITRARTAIGNIVLPRAADPAPAFPRGLEEQIDGVTPLRTPTGEFYRVDTRLSLPLVDVDEWRLTIDGDVENELTLTFEDLLAMPLIERDITLTCVSNEVGGRYVSAARWLGVRLTDLLDRAKVGNEADQILSTDVDGFTISTPLEVATDGRDTMVAVGMNGEALPREHGFPARLITPGLYGFVGATKWVTRLTLTRYADERAYWTRKGWATDAPIKVASRIDTPAPLSRIKAGRTAIGGVAWAQHRGIRAVEVRIDEGPWQRARLGPDVGVDYWRQWYLPWDAEAGSHELAVRAVTREGERQTTDTATPFPNGSSGLQQITVTVA